MARTRAKTLVVTGTVLVLAAGIATVVIVNSGRQPATSQQAAPASEESFKQQSLARMNQAKQWALACFMFAQDHQSEFPKNFDQIKAGGYVRDLSDLNWEIVSGGNINSFTNPVQTSRTILLREAKPRLSPDGKYIRVYAFADGHAELISSPDSDFDVLEKQRGLLVVPAKN